MLAGYLPFDDDPANPEGDNINLLYKYIVSTPLTFPEYVTPHARDLLRRILVPDPRKRADLFEVARHSWLSEYTHVVGFIGSSVKSEKDVTPAALDRQDDATYLNRSASVREPTSKLPEVNNRASANVPRHGPAASIGGDEASDIRRYQQQQQRDAKRNTVQLEYVPPFIAGRGDAGEAPSPTVPSGNAPLVGRTRARAEGQGPVEVSQQRRQEPNTQAASSKYSRDQRSTSEAMQTYAGPAPVSTSRPNTSGALGSTSRLPSRGNSYSQPSAAQPTTANAQGSFSQPRTSSGYIIGTTGQLPEQNAVTDPARPASHTQSTQTNTQFQNPQPIYPTGRPGGGHKRSSTLGSITDKILSRTNSKRASQQDPAGLVNATNEKRDRRYPPVSMKNAMPNAEAQPRPSTDSRRPSFGFTRKASRERDSSVQGRRTSRRFSLLPSSFSVSNILGRKEQGYDSNTDDGQQQGEAYQSQSQRSGRPQSKGMPFGRGSRSPSGSTTNSAAAAQRYYDERDPSRTQQGQPRSGAAQPGALYNKALPAAPVSSGMRSASASQTATPPPIGQRKQFRDDLYGGKRSNAGEPVERFYTPHQDAAAAAAATGAGQAGQYQPSDLQHAQSAQQYDEYDDENLDGNQHQSAQPISSLRPQQRKFGDAYEHGHGGSSSATRRVMDFFRRRGKDRAEG